MMTYHGTVCQKLTTKMHREAQTVSASKRLNCEGVNNRHKKMVLSVMFQITFENTETFVKTIAR